MAKLKNTEKSVVANEIIKLLKDRGFDSITRSKILSTAYSIALKDKSPEAKNDGLQ